MSSSDGRVDYKSQVLGAIDIVELIGRSVALKQRGTNFVGLCPFHQEKSPSFSVNRARQFFHCFGCKASGNAIDFVMKRDRLEFIDALKQLGQQAGIEMPRYGVSKQKAGEKQAQYEANSAAGAFFQQMLRDPEKGAAGRAYLDQRGFNAEAVKQFQIGLAVEGWDALLKSPVGRKFTATQLAAAGLVKARDGSDGYYDTFRNRLMFPIKDVEGRIIAFGGRVMPGSQDPAKYLNSPETAIFSKKSTIFGLNLARQKILESRTAVIVEGYTDVVMAHQFGASNVVSPLGTALGEDHVRLLRRYLTDAEQPGRIVLLFDADTAGDTAVDRSVGLFLTQEIEIAIASLPERVDPDEFLLNEGLEGFEKLIAAAPDALTYKWQQLSRRFNAEGGNLTGQQKAVEEYLELLASARGTGPVDPVRWGLSLARVSRLTGIPVEDLNRQFRSAKKNGQRFERPQFGAGPNPMNASPGGGGSATTATPRRPMNARDRAERQIIGLLLAKPEWWDAVQKHVGPADFTDDGRRRLAEAYWNHQRDEGRPVFNEFLGLLGDDHDTSLPDVRELAVELLDAVDALPDPKAALQEAVGFVQEDRERSEGRKLIADAKRSNGKDLSEQAEIDLLRKIEQQARRPDLRRT